MDKNENHIEALKQALLEKFGRALDSPFDYEDLSDAIQIAAKDKVSATTLKRLYGYVKPATVPRTSTLSILARYVGYTGWSDFCEKHSIHEESVLTPPPTQPPVTHDGPDPKQILIAISAIVLTAAIIILSLKIFMRPDVNSKNSQELIHFTSEDSEEAKYAKILESCLETAEAECDKVWEQYGKMDINEFWNLVYKEHSRIVFGVLQDKVKAEVSEAFDDEGVREKYKLSLISHLREYCAQRLLREFPTEELMEKNASNHLQD